jgi:hypothetical protein
MPNGRRLSRLCGECACSLERRDRRTPRPQTAPPDAKHRARERDVADPNRSMTKGRAGGLADDGHSPFVGSHRPCQRAARAAVGTPQMSRSRVRLTPVRSWLAAGAVKRSVVFPAFQGLSQPVPRSVRVVVSPAVAMLTGPARRTAMRKALLMLLADRSLELVDRRLRGGAAIAEQSQLHRPQPLGHELDQIRIHRARAGQGTRTTVGFALLSRSLGVPKWRFTRRWLGRVASCR